MKMNKSIVNTTYPIHASLISSHYDRAFWDHIRRAALLTAALGTTVVLATSCSSTRTGMNARLISPVPTSQQAANFEEENWYQPSLSPGFDSDLFGG
jgi:Trk-type K+ transport system membrane component